MQCPVAMYILLPILQFAAAQNIYSSAAQGLCHPSTTCMRLSECGLLNDLVHRSCIAADRFRSLTCGYVAMEPMLCCPTGGKPSITPGLQHQTLWSSYDSTRSDDTKPCGVPRVKGLTGFNGIGTQPWVVRIGFTNTNTNEVKYPCGGSILNNQVVLTAAHCALAKSDNFKLQTILAGEWASHTETDCGKEFCGLPAQKVPVSHVVVHPGYQQDNTYRHDVALIVLKQPINFTVTAQPICIFEGHENLIGEHATLVGWGKLAGQQAQPSIQQSLTMPIVPLDKCRKVYGATVPLGSDEEQLCVGGVAEGQDACAGFGGSPLIAKHLTGGVFYQVGMLSFGADQCGSEGVPSVYTNLQHYAHWIRENTPLLY